MSDGETHARPSHRTAASGGHATQGNESHGSGRRPARNNRSRADHDGDWRRGDDEEEEQKDVGQSWRGDAQNGEGWHWNGRSSWNDGGGWRDSGWQEYARHNASSTHGKVRSKGGKGRGKGSSTNDIVEQSRNENGHHENSHRQGRGNNDDWNLDVEDWSAPPVEDWSAPAVQSQWKDEGNSHASKGSRDRRDGKGKGGGRRQSGAPVGSTRGDVEDNEDEVDMAVQSKGSRDRRDGKGKAGGRRLIGPTARSAKADVEDNGANDVPHREEEIASQASSSRDRRDAKGKGKERRRIGPSVLGSVREDADEKGAGDDDALHPEGEIAPRTKGKHDRDKRGGKGRGQSGPHSGKGRQSYDADLTQTQTLRDELGKGSYECMICINKVRKYDPIWSCTNCYAALHIKCIHQWIKKSSGDSRGPEFAWSCPGCRYHFVDTLPKYTCFCGKMLEPESNPHYLAHSCGEVCGRKRNNCPHACNELCHAGPCPPCTAKGPPGECHCGREVKAVTKCGDPSRWSCQSTCDKTLACGKHTCPLKCHAGPCPPCSATSKQLCFCGAKSADRVCGEEAWDCGGVCGKLLDCGEHYCQEKCHPGPCGPCERVPEVWGDRCACGRTKNCKGEAAAALLVKWVGARTRCTDPLPLCGSRCDRPLQGCEHRCSKSCHEGTCPPCDKKVLRECRCRRSKIELPCVEGTVAVCMKVCGTKKHCGIHKCDIICCPGHNDRNHEDHFCLQVCGKPLACGVHVCEEFCHLGKCPPCSVFSHEPLCCACGQESILPPVRCGTAPPRCREICAGMRSCGHLCTSTCHFGEHPLCCELVDRQCLGGHRIMKNQPCHVGPMSCGEKCGQRLDCGHACAATCHSGDCPPCTQPCGAPRVHCEHRCEAPCHPGEPCEDAPCQCKIKASCACGTRVETQVCGAFSGRSKPVVAVLKCGNSCAERSRTPSTGSIKRSTQEERYAADIHGLAVKNNKYVVVLENVFIAALSSNSRMALPPCDMNRRILAMEYARLHWRLHTTTKRDTVDGWYVITIDGATRGGRAPQLMLSEILAATNVSSHLSARLDRQPCLRFIGCKGQGDEIYELVGGSEDLLGVRPGQDAGEIIAFLQRGSTATATFRKLTSQEPVVGQAAPVTFRNFGSSGLQVSLENILMSLGGPSAAKSTRGSAWGKAANASAAEVAPKPAPKPRAPQEPEPVADSWEDM